MEARSSAVNYTNFYISVINYINFIIRSLFHIKGELLEFLQNSISFLNLNFIHEIILIPKPHRFTIVIYFRTYIYFRYLLPLYFGEKGSRSCQNTSCHYCRLRDLRETILSVLAKLLEFQ